MTTETLSVKLGANVGINGTISFNYPAGKSADDYAGGGDARIYSMSQGPIYQQLGEFTIAYGSTALTVTLSAGRGFAKGDTVYFNTTVGSSADRHVTPAYPDIMSVMTPIKVNLGAPIASDPNGYVETQNLTTAGVFSVDTTAAGALAAAALDGVADVPRNVVAAWTTSAKLTITGTDVDGNVIVEETGTAGTAHVGKKAFKTVTDIAASVDITGLTVGTGKVLGLPGYLADVTDVIAEMQDNAKATAGTVVAGVTDVATATTGDPRGTYAPNSNPNGALKFQVVVLARDPASKGVTPFGG